MSNKIEVEVNEYEATSLRLELPGSMQGSDPAQVATPITLEKISVAGGASAILLRHVFSPSECQHFIDQAESLGLKSVSENGYKATYRDNDRVVAMGDDVAKVLFARVAPFLEQDVVIDDSNSMKHHQGVKGLWRLHHVNPCFRLCRYHPGGHFSPHYDGEYVRSAALRSLKTLMLYLNGNGDFQGGSTNFLDDNHELTLDPATGKYVGMETAVYARVRPEPGMAIVFDHKILHEGAPVTQGKKYIMRSEAMYELVDRRMTPEEDEFHMLIQRAQKLESEGETDEAARIYFSLPKKYPTLAPQWGLK